MKPSNKSNEVESQLISTFGFDRRDAIKADRCVPPPIGCGKKAIGFRDDLSRKEFTISGLCQLCQDRVFVGAEQPALYRAAPDEFVTEDYSTFNGQAHAVARKYYKYVGKSGNTWLVADQAAAAEDIYVTNNPQNTTSKAQWSEGFGDATLHLSLVEGGVFELHGGWHTNADALFEDTGIDVRETHRTFVVLSKERDTTRDGTYRTILRGVVYRDDAPVLGRFYRYEALVERYPEANYYYSATAGGSSCGPTRQAKGSRMTEGQLFLTQ